MTTARQVARVFKPLLSRHTDLHIEGRFLIVKPVRHILRGVYIDRSSSADWAQPRWTFLPLCISTREISFTLDSNIWPPDRRRPSLDLPSYADWLVDHIEQETLPFIRTIDNIETYINHRRFNFLPLPQKGLTSFIRYDRMCLAAGLGRFDLFDEDYKYFQEVGCSPQADQSYANLFRKLVVEFAPIVFSRDRPSIAAKLREWEAYSVRNLKIEHLWEKTPFPIELSSGDVA